MINKEKYDGYIESLLNAARLTTKENSVLINFNIEEEVCTNTVEFIQQDGTKDTLKKASFICDDEFYKEFLEKFVLAYYNSMVVVVSDSIDMNADNKYTYRIITDDNDLMSIDGITLEYANYLMKLVKTDEERTKKTLTTNEKGNVTFLYTLFLISAIGMVIIATALLLG